MGITIQTIIDKIQLEYTLKPIATGFMISNPKINEIIEFEFDNDIGLLVKPYNIPKNIEKEVILLIENIAIVRYKTDIFFEEYKMDSNLMEKFGYEIDEYEKKLGYYKELTDYDNLEKRIEDLKITNLLS